MWWLLAFCSAALLGCYDSAKKISLKDNAVIPVLFLNTVFSALIFSPFLFTTGFGGWDVQKYILLKSALVLSSWMAGYFAMKHLPLTIVGPVNATRPVLVLIGALFLFGERLNLLQWIGVGLAVGAYLMLLGFIGIKMICDALQGGDSAEGVTTLTHSRLLALAVATSIDAMAVGVSFAFSPPDPGIWLSCALIGCATFLLTLAAAALGKRVRIRKPQRAGIIGGVVLLALGIKLLLEGIL